LGNGIIKTGFLTRRIGFSLFTEDIDFTELQSAQLLKMEPEEIDKIIEDLSPLMTPKVPFQALNDIMRDIHKVLGVNCANTVWAVISNRYPGYYYSSDRKRLCKSALSSFDEQN